MGASTTGTGTSLFFFSNQAPGDKLLSKTQQKTEIELPFGYIFGLHCYYYYNKIFTFKIQPCSDAQNKWTYLYTVRAKKKSYTDSL